MSFSGSNAAGRNNQRVAGLEGHNIHIPSSLGALKPGSVVDEDSVSVVGVSFISRGHFTYPQIIHYNLLVGEQAESSSMIESRGQFCHLQ